MTCASNNANENLTKKINVTDSYRQFEYNIVTIAVESSHFHDRISDGSVGANII